MTFLVFRDGAVAGGGVGGEVGVVGGGVGEGGVAGEEGAGEGGGVGGEEVAGGGEFAVDLWGSGVLEWLRWPGDFGEVGRDLL